MFYDNFIKEIAICINVGDTRVSRDIELPSYRSIQHRSKGCLVHNSKVSAIGFDTPSQLLPSSVLDRIDEMLQEAAEQGLTHCGSRGIISDFIMSYTDLTECHLCALNEMMSLK